jgi:hypothetical protein
MYRTAQEIMPLRGTRSARKAGNIHFDSFSAIIKKYKITLSMENPMKYQFTFRNNAADMMQIFLYFTYHMFVGAVNIIFTLASLVLMIAKIRSGETMIALAAAVLMLYFPCIQPLIVYLRSRKSAAKQTDDTQLSFSDEEILIRVGEKSQTLTWAQILAVQKLPSGVFLRTGKGYGLDIPDRVLKEKREEFYQFALEKVRKEHAK